MQTPSHSVNANKNLTHSLSRKKKKQSAVGRLHGLPSPACHRPPPLTNNNVYIAETPKAEDKRRRAHEQLTQMKREADIDKNRLEAEETWHKTLLLQKQIEKVQPFFLLSIKNQGKIVKQETCQGHPSLCTCIYLKHHYPEFSVLLRYRVLVEADLTMDQVPGYDHVRSRLICHCLVRHGLIVMNIVYWILFNYLLNLNQVHSQKFISFLLFTMTINTNQVWKFFTWWWFVYSKFFCTSLLTSSRVKFQFYSYHVSYFIHLFSLFWEPIFTFIPILALISF